MLSIIRSKSLFLQNQFSKNFGSYIRQSLVINAIFLFGINLSPAALGFLFWGVVGRLYQPAQVGLASAIISTATLVSSIAGLGMSTGLIRFLPGSDHPVRILNTAYTFSFLLSILVSVIFLVGIPFWSAKLDILIKSPFFFISFILLIIFATLGTVVRDTFTARRTARYGFYYALISNSTRLGVVLLLAFLGTVGITSAIVVAFGVALLVAWLFYLPKVETDYLFKFHIHREDLSLLIPYSVGTYFAGFMTQVSQTILPMIIFSVLGPEMNAYAYIALMLGSMLSSPGLALATSAFAESSNDLGRSVSVFKRAAGTGFLVTIAVSLVALLMAPFLLSFFGSGYVANAKSLLAWLCFSAPFAVIMQFGFAYLQLVKKIVLLNIANGICAAVTLLGTALFIARIGVAAPGIAVFLGNVITCLFLVFCFGSEFKD